VRRLSEGSPPYMCRCVRVGSFELPHLIISKYVILINPHVLRVRIPFCYGRSTVVSDLDGWGFVLNV
jgi:hypothetical protein